MVSKVDREDDGQKCVAGFVNAIEEEWVNAAEGRGKGRLFVAMFAVGVTLAFGLLVA
jgi:hypothetical protein